VLNLRQANINDHKFLVQVDLKNDGYTVSNEVKMTEQEKNEHRNKVMSFLIDKDKGAFIVEDTKLNKPIGMIMYSIVNRDSEIPYTIYNELDRGVFQKDGRFLEIFQLWVNEKYRRLGLATKLKLRLEEEAKLHKVNLIYTHTEEENHHVLELNRKLGYKVVRSGPIWDDVIRVSLMKKIIS
jgi:ribosomal protein S18 acetylase RimI-like enzyme